MNTSESQSQLDILYDGPALADGSMDVRDLAPAMMAVGSFFEAANRLTNGDRATINVNVRATSAGSFHIAFEVIQNIESTGILGADIGDFLTVANDLKALLVGGGGVAGGIILLLKHLRNRTPRVTKVNESLYTLTVDGETYEVPLELLRVYQDVNARRAVQNMVLPVNNPGVDRFVVREGDSVVHSVTKADVGAFAFYQNQDLVLDEVRRQAFSIVTLAFRERNKWRLTDGESDFSVSMLDEGFRRRVDGNEVAFSRGDVLVCDLRTRQWQTEAGIRTEYEVVRVVEYRPVRQLSLLDEEDRQSSV